MSTAATFSVAIREALLHPSRGVVGLVEDLLAACPDEGLQLEWNTQECSVRFLGTNNQASISVPLRKSIFRAILARVAVLCNERCSDGVTPYGGEGELSASPNQEMVFRVNFVNTPDEQRLIITPVQPKANGTP